MSACAVGIPRRRSHQMHNHATWLENQSWLPFCVLNRIQLIEASRSETHLVIKRAQRWFLGQIFCGATAISPRRAPKSPPRTRRANWISRCCMWKVHMQVLTCVGRSEQESGSHARMVDGVCQNSRNIIVCQKQMNLLEDL